MSDEQGNTLEFEGFCHYIGVEVGAINPKQNFVSVTINMEVMNGKPYSIPRRFGRRNVRITIVDLTDEEGAS